jgi:hypothetical protein
MPVKFASKLKNLDHGRKSSAMTLGRRKAPSGQKSLASNEIRHLKIGDVTV